ncbi:hypothetical protein MRB53_022623 [Persea americana]|uniref:Uncharacterized protein n=1 Tax=Persea americana TaxID=3435 RepID=A0ACC2L7R5_PERAE|nr:hypothetical protein MRB53_022623 [Persea americana]
MSKVPLTHRRYIYIHDEKKGSSQAIDSHHIVVRKGNATNVLFCLIAPLIFANICYFLLVKEKPGISFLWCILFSVFIIKSLHGKSIKKESVVIMPALGVQLETHYCSGMVIRRFVPIGKILKPVINECVTPVTCYWSLALIARDEAELILVFKELRPPVSMLVPVWKALCAVVNDVETTDAKEEDH